MLYQESLPYAPRVQSEWGGVSDGACLTRQQLLSSLKEVYASGVASRLGSGAGVEGGTDEHAGEREENMEDCALEPQVLWNVFVVE